MKRFLILALAFSIFPVSFISAVDLKEDLDEATFANSGLDKLTAEELAVLNAAVANLLNQKEDSVRAEVDLPKGDDRFGLETVKERVAKLFQNDGPERIESSISGEFKGWRGDAKFHLDNGQVWQQTEPDTFIVNVKNPKVFIRRGMFGSYLLKIEGYNSSVKVERIK